MAGREPGRVGCDPARGAEPVTVRRARWKRVLIVVSMIAAMTLLAISVLSIALWPSHSNLRSLVKGQFGSLMWRYAPWVAEMNSAFYRRSHIEESISEDCNGPYRQKAPTSEQLTVVLNRTHLVVGDQRPTGI
jgi:hypothetical protein